MTIFDDVGRFMDLADQRPEDILSRMQTQFVARCQEEMGEVAAANTTLSADDSVEAREELLDGYIDLIYTAACGAVAYVGEKRAQEAWNRVSRANLSKVDGSIEPLKKDMFDKVIKPRGWKAPDLTDLVK